MAVRMGPPVSRFEVDGVDRKTFLSWSTSPLKESLEQGVRYSYFGFTMVVLVGGFLYGGYWIDQRYGTGPWGTLVGLGLGILFGFGYFVLEMVRLVQEGQERHDRDHQNES